MLFRRHDRAWIVQAPAKVNLFLRVVGKRPDGYHEIETVMARLNLCDTLSVAPTDTSALSLRVRLAYPPGLRATPVPESDENLALKAAHLLRQRTGCDRGANLQLVKRIPAAAGLGGGSSDAATALWVLNRLWELGLSVCELQQLAAELGSDVPFFLANSGFALCTGRGERIEPLTSSACLWLVLAKPESGLSTAAVYRGCRPDADAQALQPLLVALQRGDAASAACHLRNTLQPPAETLNSDVARLKAEFARLPVCGHQLTGSGSAYFGICRNQRHADVCAARLRSRGVAAVWTVSTCS
jgi:4-diphosphocytidyl-2-C-methyl-D-erythritol kinase